MLRALVLFSVLAASAGLQIAAVPTRSSIRAATLCMQEEKAAATEDAAADEPVGPMASKAIGSDPFAFEGIGKVRRKISRCASFTLTRARDRR